MQAVGKACEADLMQAEQRTSDGLILSRGNCLYWDQLKQLNKSRQQHEQTAEQNCVQYTTVDQQLVQAPESVAERFGDKGRAL